MASKIPQGVMDLKKFMLRSEVLKLYRHILRTIKDVPDPKDRQDLQQWARHDFDMNKHLQDDYLIKLALHQGRQNFERLARNIQRTR